MRNMLLRGVNALMTALRVAAGAMLVASVGINFVNIIGRYVFSVSIPWAEEAMLFLMIGCVFLGAGPVGYLGRHIRMDVVVLALPPRARKVFEIFSDLVTIATCVMLAVFAWPVVTMLGRARRTQRHRQYSAGHSAIRPAARASAHGVPDRGEIDRLHGAGRTDLGPRGDSGH